MWPREQNLRLSVTVAGAGSGGTLLSVSRGQRTTALRNSDDASRNRDLREASGSL